MIPDWAWGAWFLGTILVFVVLEVRAINNGPRTQDALTHAIRRFFRVDRVLGAFAFFAFLAVLAFVLIWLAAHIVEIAV